MAFTGKIASLHVLPQAGSEGLAPEDMACEFFNGMLAGGTVDLTTALTSVDFCVFTNTGGTKSASGLAWAASGSTITVKGDGSETFCGIAFGRVAKQI